MAHGVYMIHYIPLIYRHHQLFAQSKQ